MTQNGVFDAAVPKKLPEKAASLTREGLLRAGSTPQGHTFTLFLLHRRIHKTNPLSTQPSAPPPVTPPRYLYPNQNSRFLTLCTRTALLPHTPLRNIFS